MQIGKIVASAALIVAAIGVATIARFEAQADPLGGRLAAPTWADGDCAQGWTDNRYVGLSQTELRDALGEADVDHWFRLSRGVTEMSVTLLDHYSIEDEPDRRILQQSWTHGGCNLVIWSSEEDGRMTSVDRVRYPDSIEL